MLIKVMSIGGSFVKSARPDNFLPWYDEQVSVFPEVDRVWLVRCRCEDEGSNAPFVREQWRRNADLS